MKKLCLKLTFTLPIFIFFACDCLQKVEGIVYDELSNKPILGVSIYKKDKPYQRISTDSLGVFSFSDITGGRDCNKVTLVFEKDNYINDTIIYSSNETSANIKLRMRK